MKSLLSIVMLHEPVVVTVSGLVALCELDGATAHDVTALAVGVALTERLEGEVLFSRHAHNPQGVQLFKTR